MEGALSYNPALRPVLCKRVQYRSQVKSSQRFIFSPLKSPHCRLRCRTYFLTIYYSTLPYPPLHLIPTLSSRSTFKRESPVIVLSTLFSIFSSSLAVNLVCCIRLALMTPRSFSLSLLANTENGKICALLFYFIIVDDLERLQPSLQHCDCHSHHANSPFLFKHPT